ncbi:MAG: response regulator [Candidatus Heimdallarchaeaceae archaeon]
MKKIYIIEDEKDIKDEKDISNLYQLLFQKEGIEVEGIVASGKEAIEEIEGFKDKIEDIVFLIDNRIPEKSGIEVARRIINISPFLKNQIIIATADDTLSEEEVKELGINHFLRKPFSLEDLKAAVENIQNMEKNDEG